MKLLCSLKVNVYGRLHTHYYKINYSKIDNLSIYNNIVTINLYHELDNIELELTSSIHLCIIYYIII